MPGARDLEYKGWVVSSFPERVYAIVLEVPPGCVITYSLRASVTQRTRYTIANLCA